MRIGKLLFFRFVVGTIFAAYACTTFMPLSVKNAQAEKNEPIQNKEYSRAECVMELNSRRVLYEHNGDQRLPMASTTKIATAITVLSLCDDIGAEFSIPQEAVGVEGSSVYLQQGDVYSVEELLYGLMLRSGNDCATALALYCGGTVQNFAAKMNETAQKAGAMATNFRNPHGLPCDMHYTTARDLTAIACYGMQNPCFEKIVSTKYYEPRRWKNKNKMLSGYDGAIGVKTGYTKEAGRCLVTAAKRGNMTLLCTVLNCPTMYERTATLLDDAFSAYKYQPLALKTDEFVVEENGKRKVGRLDQDVYYPLLEEEKEWIEIKTVANTSGKTRENGKEIVGKLEIYLTKRLLFSGNLYKL